MVSSLSNSLNGHVPYYVRRWQCISTELVMGWIVMLEFHEGGKARVVDLRVNLGREVCGLLWWRGAVGGGAGGGRGGAQKQCTGLENTGRCIQV